MQSISVSRGRTRDLAYIALMAALMAVCSWITIPLGPVPFTMQNFAVFAALALLGGRRGTLSLLLFLCLGFVGLPVFSGFSGGPGVLLGVTGGYLVGYALGALAYWGFTALLGDRPGVRLFGLILVMLLCYAFGSAWFYFVYTAGGESITLGAILGMCVLPFAVPDGGKLFLALILKRRIGKYIQ